MVMEEADSVEMFGFLDPLALSRPCCEHSRVTRLKAARMNDIRSIRITQRIFQG